MDWCRRRWRRSLRWIGSSQAGVNALRGGLEIFLNCSWALSFSLLSCANLVTYLSTWTQSHNGLMLGCNILKLSFSY